MRPCIVVLLTRSASLHLYSERVEAKDELSSADIKVGAAGNAVIIAHDESKLLPRPCAPSCGHACLPLAYLVTCISTYNLCLGFCAVFKLHSLIML